MADPGPVLCWGCSSHPVRVNKTQWIHSKRIMQRGAICWYPTFLVDQIVKNLSIKQGSPVRPLGQEDPLEKGMATHSSIFTWKIPWTEEPGGLQSMESQRVKHDRATLSLTHTHTQLPFSAPYWSIEPKVRRLFFPDSLTRLIFKRSPWESCVQDVEGEEKEEPCFLQLRGVLQASRHRRCHSGEEPAFQCRRCKRRCLDPWVETIPWTRRWQPTPVVWKIPWTEESGGLQSRELQTATEHSCSLYESFICVQTDLRPGEQPLWDSCIPGLLEGSSCLLDLCSPVVPMVV